MNCRQWPISKEESTDFWLFLLSLPFHVPRSLPPSAPPPLPSTLPSLRRSRYSRAIKNRSGFDHAGRQNRVAFVTTCNSFVLTIPSGPCQPPRARRSFTLSQDAAPRCARLVTRRETQDPDRGPDPRPPRIPPSGFSPFRPAASNPARFTAFQSPPHRPFPAVDVSRGPVATCGGRGARQAGAGGGRAGGRRGSIAQAQRRCGERYGAKDKIWE